MPKRKARAARQNGQKGGRPRKHTVKIEGLGYLARALEDMKPKFAQAIQDAVESEARHIAYGDEQHSPKGIPKKAKKK